MRRLLRRLHRDEEAAIAPLLLFIGLAFAYMLVLIMNTSQAVYEKQRAQNSADAIAMIHADWAARYLNVMSMNNVGITQMQAIFVTSLSLSQVMLDLSRRAGDTWNTIERYKQAHCAWLLGIPIVGAAAYKNCIKPYEAQKKGAEMTGRGIPLPLTNVGNILVAYNPPGVALKSISLLRSLGRMNDELFNTFPERVGMASRFLLDKNGGDHVVFHPPCVLGEAATCKASRGAMEGSDLPVIRPRSQGTLQAGAAIAEMCTAANEGTQGNARKNFSAHGFQAGKGPFTGGGADGSHLRDHVNKTSEIDFSLVFFDRIFYHPGNVFEALRKGAEAFSRAKAAWLGGGVYGVLTGAISLIVPRVYALPPFLYSNVTPHMYPQSQDWEQNEFTRKLDENWGRFCGNSGWGQVASSIARAALQGLAGDLAGLGSPYWLKGRGTASGYIPEARVLDRPNEWSVLAILSTKVGYRTLDESFEDAVPYIFGYAEALTINLTSFDLYTQTWQATLVASRHMNEASKLLPTLRNRAPDESYRPLVRMLERVQGDDNAIKAINNH